MLSHRPTVAPSVCPCSIWSNTTTPAVLADPDNVAIEVGVKFRASSAGYISGIRFYKSSTNTGTHIGNLWSSAGGPPLATATFSNETTSGWQQVNFATPVQIAANTTYIASYHTDTGHYSVNDSYFATAGVTNGPLQALQNGVDGGNGVYIYGASAFPTTSYRSSNYWVDVVFETTQPGAAAPKVTGVSPNAGTTAGGTSVTLTGSNFASGATVAFGGTAATNVSVVSATSITATTPPHAAGAVSVVVTNPDGTNGTLASGFTYRAPPTVTGLMPNNGMTAGGTIVTISGTNFVSGATVSFGQVAATSVTYKNATTLTAKAPAQAAGVVDVTVTTPGGTSATSPSDQFTYVVRPLGDDNIERRTDSDAAGLAEAFQYTANTTSSVTQLALYVDSTTTATQVVLGLYSTTAAGTNPSALLAQASFAPVNGAWNTVTIPPVTITAGTKYWIAVLSPAGGGRIAFRDLAATTGGLSRTSSQTNLTSLPATWTTGGSAKGSPMSAYAAP